MAYNSSLENFRHYLSHLLPVDNAHSMQHIIDFIRQATGARDATPIEKVQTLWSGYGQIIRFQLIGCEHQSVIVKFISPPSESTHPRGWNTNLSHQRKLKSYQVEVAWYQTWANQCNSECYVPRCLGIEQQNQTTTIILEDLDASGFPSRSESELSPCLHWLANFHATFMGAEPTDLWPVGTYWHLDTRPDEWAAMEDGPLKQAASILDAQLNQARFKTLVHGDAKVANFCFSTDKQKVASVDFQYVGGGCGMKDLAYFMGSCLTEDECEKYLEYCLNTYFEALKQALQTRKTELDFIALENEWRSLFPVAWADFYRFLAGWMPTHKKINRFSTSMTERVLASL